jgi:hypothetical protein
MNFTCRALLTKNILKELKKGCLRLNFWLSAVTDSESRYFDILSANNSVKLQQNSKSLLGMSTPRLAVKGNQGHGRMTTGKKSYNTVIWSRYVSGSTCILHVISYVVPDTPGSFIWLVDVTVTYLLIILASYLSRVKCTVAQEIFASKCAFGAKFYD